MSSRLPVARAKFLLLVSLVSTYAGLAGGSAGQSGAGRVELSSGSGEVASAGTTELPVPPSLPPTTVAPAEAATTAALTGAPDGGPTAPAGAAPTDPGAGADAAGQPQSAPAPPPPTPPAEPPAAPLPPLMPADAMVPPARAAMKPILLQAAAEHGLPADLVLAQAWAESSWQDSAVSSAQAVGVLQLTAPTVDFVSRQLLRLDHSLDPLNPTDNARMGARYLRHLLTRTENDLRQALIAYNQGLGALRRNGPYAEARRYADRVLALRPMFVSGGTAGPPSARR